MRRDPRQPPAGADRGGEGGGGALRLVPASRSTSQSVLLRGVNDDAATLERLFRELVAMRVKPYYLHHPDLARGTGSFPRRDRRRGKATADARVAPARLGTLPADLCARHPGRPRQGADLGRLAAAGREGAKHWLVEDSRGARFYFSSLPGARRRCRHGPLVSLLSLIINLMDFRSIRGDGRAPCRLPRARLSDRAWKWRQDRRYLTPVFEIIVECELFRSVRLACPAGCTSRRRPRRASKIGSRSTAGLRCRRLAKAFAFTGEILRSDAATGHTVVRFDDIEADAARLLDLAVVRRLH